MDLIAAVKSKDKKTIDEALENFLTENLNVFTFTSFSSLSIQKELWNVIVDLMNDRASHDLHVKCIQALKILSRDKQHLNNILGDGIILTLLTYAKLNLMESTSIHSVGILDAQKCIFNLIISNVKCRTQFLDAFIMEAVLVRLNQHLQDGTVLHEIQLFDLKILFLLSAYCPNCRPRLRYTLKGVDHMMKLLDRNLFNSEGKVNKEEAECCSEALKIIFNMLLATNRPDIDNIPEFHSELFSLSERDETQQIHHLMSIVSQCLTVKMDENDHQDLLKSHAVNLLTVINPDFYGDLHSKSQSLNTSQEMDMSSVTLLLEFLENLLELPVQMLKEKLSPILTVLIIYCRKHPEVRKFIRAHILPPLRDVTHRPEEGETLRNKLCRLMTCTVSHVETLVAEFLFILCKQNVRRLVKYTGYGNAAGLLANRGLLLGHQPDHQPENSSDSEDSDTEEYAQAEEKINPVTGCFEAPRANPMDGMTDEQKEFEAVRLLNIIDKLQREGIIQPARIGEDGKPHPVEHVLQLQEGGFTACSTKPGQTPSNDSKE